MMHAGLCLTTQASTNTTDTDLRLAFIGYGLLGAYVFFILYRRSGESLAVP